MSSRLGSREIFEIRRERGKGKRCDSNTWVHADIQQQKEILTPEACPSANPHGLVLPSCCIHSSHDTSQPDAMRCSRAFLRVCITLPVDLLDSGVLLSLTQALADTRDAGGRLQIVSGVGQRGHPVTRGPEVGHAGGSSLTGRSGAPNNLEISAAAKQNETLGASLSVPELPAGQDQCLE